MRTHHLTASNGMSKRLLILLLLLLPATLLRAEGWVRDHAQVLNPVNHAHLEALLKDVNQKTSAEVMVITVHSLNRQDVDTFATQMFNQIGIGNRDTHNGVLFLTAPNERRTRIEVGYGLEPLITDARAGHILDSRVIPYFRRDDMQTGIIAGTEAIAELLLAHPEAARGVSGAAPLYVASAENHFKLALYGALLLALLLFALYFIIRRRKRFPIVLVFVMGALALATLGLIVMAWRALGEYDEIPLLHTLLGGGALLWSALINGRLFHRYRPRSCPSCRTPMRLLSETEEDHHLDNTQQLEEKLRAVDYDVWYCPACLNTQTERYVAFNSGYRACVQCRAHTYSETTTTLVSATQSRGGKVRIDGLCKSCEHTTTRTQNTPRLSSTSGSGSGGGGSFGGGGSGGGGASRSW